MTARKSAAAVIASHFDRAADTVQQNADRATRERALALCHELARVYSLAGYEGDLLALRTLPPTETEEECGACRGSGEWETECCSGASGCSCRGDGVPMGACQVCHGRGVIGPDADRMANIRTIEGASYIGSGPTSWQPLRGSVALNLVPIDGQVLDAGKTPAEGQE